LLRLRRGELVLGRLRLDGSYGVLAARDLELGAEAAHRGRRVETAPAAVGNCGQYELPLLLNDGTSDVVDPQKLVSY